MTANWDKLWAAVAVASFMAMWALPLMLVLLAWALRMESIRDQDRDSLVRESNGLLRGAAYALMALLVLIVLHILYGN
jgi:hypothetical protein